MSEIAAPPAMTEEPAAPRGRGRPRQFNIDRATESCDALFRSRGYDRVTLQDLTGAIGINPPSFYAAFGNKALLFIRIADSYSNDWLGEVRRTFDEEPNLADALETIVLSAARRFAWREQETDDGHRHGWGGCLLLEAANNCSDVGVTAHLRKARLSIAAALYRGISRTAPERVVTAREIDDLEGLFHGAERRGAQLVERGLVTQELGRFHEGTPHVARDGPNRARAKIPFCRCSSVSAPSPPRSELTRAECPSSARSPSLAGES